MTTTAIHPEPTATVLALALTWALVKELAGDAFMAAIAALAAVTLAHASETKGKLAITWGKRILVFIGSVALAVVTGHSLRQLSSVASYADLAVVVVALGGQDSMMRYTAWRRRFFASFDPPIKPASTTPEKP